MAVAIIISVILSNTFAFSIWFIYNMLTETQKEDPNAILLEIADEMSSILTNPKQNQPLQAAKTWAIEYRKARYGKE